MFEFQHYHDHGHYGNQTNKEVGIQTTFLFRYGSVKKTCLLCPASERVKKIHQSHTEGNLLIRTVVESALLLLTS